MRKHSRAFTLLEILLVVAAIGVLAAIVIVAINPQRQLGKVRDAERQSEVGTIKDGIEQYSIDSNGEYPSEIEANTYKEVCDTEAVDPNNCPDNYVDLSGLVPEQLAAIPRGPQVSETNADTGYEVSKDENGNIAVKASNTEVDNSVKRAGTTVVVGYSLSSASYDNNTRSIGQVNKSNSIVFNGDGSKMFVIGSDNDHVYSYDLSTAYDISSASYNQSFDVSGQEGGVTGVTFNGDGTKMFVVGVWYNNVYSYNLSTAYDISSASYNRKLDVYFEDSGARGITFNGDGTKLFMVGNDNDNVYSYNLSTAYDLGSASYNQSFDVSGQTSKPTSVRFNGDGTKMFVAGDDTNNVYSYNVSTAYDLSSASYNQSYDVSGQDSKPTGVAFKGDGTKMFVMGRSTENAYSYNLSTAYDLSSASYNQVYNVSGQDSKPAGVTFNGDGTKMFVVGTENDNVYSYNLSTAYDLDSASYNQNFDPSGQDTWLKDVTFNGDGTKMFIVGTENDNVYSYNLSTAYDLSSASYNQSFDVLAQDGQMRGVTFNGNGTKMFVVGNKNDSVYSYDLSTAYDLASASYNQSYDISGQDVYPEGLRFNEDGSKMFVVGGGNDNVYSYNVSTAYDISSASYNQSYDVSGQDDQPTGMTFNGDGSKMFMVGDKADTVYRYSTTEEK